jgi:hypothetical protein
MTEFESMSRPMAEMAAVAIVATLALAGCGPATSRDEALSVPDVHDSIQQLASVRVFFAHQSVGDNIMDGVRALVEDEPTPSLHVVPLASAAAAPGGFLAHETLGVNGDPTGKTDRFVSVLEGGFGQGLDIALQKYCFIDFTAATDPDALFSYYQQGIERIHRDVPDLTVVHVTAPLMTVQTGPKAFVKRLIGRAPGQFEDNRVRERFNEQMRTAYDGREPIFDLARIESSRPGAASRVSTSFREQTAYGLLPEYTTDGGHLTGTAGKLVAAEFLRFLANVAAGRVAERQPGERP